MQTQRLGIIAATENEINPFLKQLAAVKVQSRAMLTFHMGTYKNVEVIALYCGVCKVNAAIAAQLLISECDVTNVIMIGVAGAMDESLQIADTVVASEVGYHDVAPNILTEYHPWLNNIYFQTDEDVHKAIMAANAQDKTVLSGRMVTGEAFIDQDGREQIMQAHYPLCVDMETAAVAHVCYANNIPFAAIRSISDTPHESGTDAFEKYMQQAAQKAVCVLKNYLDVIS